MKRALGVLLFLGGCNFASSYHLITASDPVRYNLAPPDAAWATQSFDDQQWPLQAGLLGPLTAPLDGGVASCQARCRFYLGPQYNAYTELTLDLRLDGRYVAYLNGAPVLEVTDSHATAKLAVPAGVLQAENNVLGIEYFPSGASTFEFSPQLDGTADSNYAGPSVTKGPYLLRPTPSGITIFWETNRDSGSVAVVGGQSYDGGSGQRHQVHVDGLEPGRAYPYHLELAGLRTEESQLATAPAAGQMVRFVVAGDNRTNGDVHRQLVEAIAGEVPDLMVNTGDMVGLSTEDEWNRFFALEYPLLVRTPLVPTVGNHEADFGDAKGRFTELFPLGYPDRFDGRVYSTDYGDVHIAVLDSNGDLEDQAQWLDDDLSAAESRGVKHLFLTMHYGPFSSGTSVAHGSNTKARDAIVPVARKHAVDAIFNGHDHFYEHGSSQGLHYFVTGGGGAPLFSPGAIDETLATRSTYHYLLVDVVGGSVRVRAKDLSGAVFDEVTIAR